MPLRFPKRLFFSFALPFIFLFLTVSTLLAQGNIVFEDWEGPYPSGNMWAAFNTCAAANYFSNPASSGEAMTTCYDSTPGDAHSGSYCWHSQITWNSCGPAQFAQLGMYSAYGGDYGYPISIASSAPSSISIWLKSSVAGQQFALFFQDTSGPNSGTPLHTTYYQDGTGANYYLTIPSANTWTNFTLPLTAGTSVWSADPTTMNWDGILDIGTAFSNPPGCSGGQQVDVYLDDYSFVAGTQNTPTPTYSPTVTFTYTPTGSATYTPTVTLTTTPTFTNTPTVTPTGSATYSPTVTPTGVSPNTLIFENWEGPYASGNMWAGFAACGQASYFSNPASSGEAITTCYDSTPGDAHSGSYCWHSNITWNTCGPTEYAQLGLDSAYGGDYGYPVSIASSAPSSISIWLKSSVAGQQFILYIQDTSGPGSGSIVHTARYQNGTGADFDLTLPTANTWTNFVLPLTAGTSVWSTDPTTMNWNAILDIGTQFSNPPGCSGGQQVDVYMDDYSFVAGTPNTPTPTYSSTVAFTYTPTGSATYTETPTTTITPTFSYTPTVTETGSATYTPTITPTGIPADALIFENWEGPYSGGNMWAGYNTCGVAGYFNNPASSGEPITTCYDSTPGDAHSGTYCWHSQITWNTCGPTQYAQLGLDSAYGGSYGLPVSIASSAPGSISIWLKSSVTGQQFVLYIQDTSGPGSGNPVHTSHFQNGTGSNYFLTITAANTWQNFVLPLTPGTSIWDVDPTTMNWNAILDIGMEFSNPPGCSGGQQVDIYMDDFYFLSGVVGSLTPTPTNTATPTSTPTGTWYTSTPTTTFTDTPTQGSPTNTPTSSATNTPTGSATYTTTQTFTPTSTNTPTGSATYTTTSTPSFTYTNTSTPGSPTNTLTSTSTDTPTGSATYTPTSTNTPTGSATYTTTSTPSFTYTNTSTPGSPTNTLTSTSTDTPTGSATYTPTSTNTPTGSATYTTTTTPSFTYTKTMTPTNSFTPSSPTATFTPTGSATYTETSTFTPTGSFTFTLTPTFTHTNTYSRTPTPTPSNSPTNSPTSTPTNSPTAYFTSTIAPTPAGTVVAYAAQVINPSSMTVVSLPDGTTISVPPASFASPGTLSITEYPITSAPGTSTAFQVNFMTYAYVIDAGGMEPIPGSSVTITLPYDPSSIPGGSTTADLALSYFNGTSWVTLPSTVNTVNHTVTVVVDHFSWWAVGSRNLSPTPTKTPVPTFSSTPGSFPTKPTLYPNPVSGSTVNLSIPWKGSLEDVKVQVYTISYRKALELDFKQVRDSVSFELKDKIGVSLSDGLYYVVVSTTHSGKSVLKLLVLR